MNLDPFYEPMTDEEWSRVLDDAVARQLDRRDALDRGIPEWEWAQHMEGRLGEHDPQYVWRETYLTEDRVDAYAPWIEGR